jgi:hypothetical protein
MWDSFLYIFSNENPKLRLSVEHSKGKTLKRKEKRKQKLELPTTFGRTPFWRI